MIEGLPTVVIARELAEQIAEALEFHDARVTELLKAASTEVIKRREINAHRLKLMDYVRNAGNKFRFYARNHRAKGTLEADEKAQVNDMMADQADRAILWESPPGEMGRP